MSKKLYALIIGIIGGIASIATACVNYCEPAYMSAITTAIPMVVTTISEVMLLFVSTNSKANTKK